jgi:hypothetical protein
MGEEGRRGKLTDGGSRVPRSWIKDPKWDEMNTIILHPSRRWLATECICIYVTLGYKIYIVYVKTCYHLS